MIDVKELKMLNQKDCRCGYYEFSLEDVKSVEQLQDTHGFYGNLVKHYSIVKCPECNRETVVLLKQVGQTWEIMNTAIVKEQEAEKEENASYTEQDAQMQLTENTPEATETANKEENNQSQEFICPECQKVCKNKIGLTAHMKTHQK